MKARGAYQLNASLLAIKTQVIAARSHRNGTELLLSSRKYSADCPVAGNADDSSVKTLFIVIRRFKCSLP